MTDLPAKIGELSLKTVILPEEGRVVNVAPRL